MLFCDVDKMFEKYRFLLKDRHVFNICVIHIVYLRKKPHHL